MKVRGLLHVLECSRTWNRHSPKCNSLNTASVKGSFFIFYFLFCSYEDRYLHTIAAILLNTDGNTEGRFFFIFCILYLLFVVTKIGQSWLFYQILVE